MKRLLIPALLGLTLLGCSQQDLPVGEARLMLSARVNSDVKVESRSDDLAATTKIWISNDKGVVRKYDSMADVPTAGVTLLSGDYLVEAWAGTLSYASFTDRWFSGSEKVSLEAGDRKSVQVDCSIQNVVVSVNYTDEAASLAPNATLTVSHKGGSLTFEGADTRKGYFMMPDGVTDLDWTLNVGEQTLTGTIAGVQKAHEYKLNVVATPKDPEQESTGYAFIAIEIDDTMVEVEDVVSITVAPEIVGGDFDLQYPVAGASGGIGLKKVFICACTTIKSATLSGVSGLGTVNLLTQASKLAAKGIDVILTNEPEGQMIEIDFTADYTNSLANSDDPYQYEIKATDANGKSSAATLTFKVSPAPVTTAAVQSSTIGYNSATLRGTKAMDGDYTYGFQYRRSGDTDWEFASATLSGTSITAKVTGLHYDCDYEYRVVTGTKDAIEYDGAQVMTFTLKPTPQLPNGDMETWDNAGQYPYTDNQFWDCGNHGSLTMNVCVTTPTTEKLHGGSRAAKLRSQFVGIGSIGKFAAGNIVVGTYLATEGTNGVFGFGKPFEFDGLRPAKLRVWAHYTQTKVTKTGSGCTLKQGDPDLGCIFFAAFSDQETYAGYTAPYVVRTADKRTFDKTASHVVAYGEHVFETSTGGSQLVQIDIPIEWYSGKPAPKYLTVVATASKEGDYFTGGEGATLFVDDFTLLYE